MLRKLKQLSKTEMIGIALIAVLYILLGAFSYRLFLRQAIQFRGPLGKYASDLPAHLEYSRLGTGYSLADIYYHFVLVTLGLNEKAVAVLIALSVVGCVFLSYRLMRKTAPDASPVFQHLLAFICTVEAAVLIPTINKSHSFGVQGGSCWHNDTYTLMRFAALPVLIMFWRLSRTYLKEIKPVDYILFAVSLTVVNWVKPNFIVAFAPAMLIVLIADFIKTRGRTVLRQLAFGIPVLLSMVVLIYQYMQLFLNEDGSSATGGFPIGLSYAYILRRNTPYPLLSVIQSAAFPLIILLINRKRLKTDRFFRFSWLFWAIGLCEYLFLHENGIRKKDGNLSWGYSFCLFFIFVICAAVYAENMKQFRLRLKSGLIMQAKDRITGCMLAAATVLLCLHAKSGIEYFCMLVRGAHYTL